VAVALGDLDNDGDLDAFIANFTAPDEVWLNASSPPLPTVPEYLITAFAGDGTEGSSGDGGAATQAQLNSPRGVAVDGAGNVYIADTGNHRIRRVGSNGIITTYAGTNGPGFSGDGGPATQAQLSSPVGVAVDGAGAVYIADRANNRIRRVDLDGIITTFAGTNTSSLGNGGPATQAMLSLPEGVAVDGVGNVYIAETARHRIRRVANGIITTFAGTGVPGLGDDDIPATQAEFLYPQSVAVDGAGNVYIADTDNHRIRRVDTNGIIRAFAGTGVRGFRGDGGPATQARLEFPGGLATDAAGNVYIADSGNRRVRRVGENGTITTIAGNG
jgi:sugar lactone lactonase YvrE